MKKSILTLSLAAFAVLGVTTNTASAQIKEGTITYAMSIPDLPPEQAAMAQGMETKIIFKNGKSRIETTSAFINSTTVTDGKGGITVLMDMMGQKTFKKMTAEEMKKAEGKTPDPKITYSDEKKTIAGYECKKAVIESKDDKGNVSTVPVWYTEKIPMGDGNKMGPNMKGLKGAALEFEMKQGPNTIQFIATNVSTSSVPDSKFEVSTEGYTEATPGSMGKGMGGQ